MFTVMFEVRPRPDRFETYLKLAAHLKPILEQSAGFIDNERFASRRRAGWILSLSSWHDEKALVRWRTDADHHRVQQRGREEVFEDYRLRVGEVTYDSDAAPPVPAVQQRFDETQAGAAKAVSLVEVTCAGEVELAAESARLLDEIDALSGDSAPIEFDVLHGILRPAKACLLLSWRNAAAAAAWSPTPSREVVALRRRSVRVVRDYGMRRREEAPQYHPAVD
jgi:heme-degrading monooxygenase HmoA